MLKINADYLSKGMRSNDSFLLESSTVWFTNSHMLSTNREYGPTTPTPTPTPTPYPNLWVQTDRFRAAYL